MKTVEYEKGTFGYDRNFLSQQDPAITILQSGDKSAQLIISAKYQGKVFTSTSEGDSGKSFGWINYKAFCEPTNKQMNAFGGENRFWLGPEGGPFSLFFDSGHEMTFSEWRTPSPIDIEEWKKVRQTSTEIEMSKTMNLINYRGSTLSILANRIVKILNIKDIQVNLSIANSDLLKLVGYETTNQITNVGTFEWNEQTGVPCIWMLDMFNPGEKTVIIVPFKQTELKFFNQIATTDYFGQIPHHRLFHTDKILFFKADGKCRSKIGIKPDKALPYAGSYDSDSKILTIVEFDISHKEKYLNQEWDTNKPAFSGDAMNAYNDGPLEDGSQMGPFYEIESVSQAAFLKPQESLIHHHSVYHITGDESEISLITEELFNLTIETIKKAL